MIDYEITVNVEGFSPEKRKKVQDAFFKLGIFWEYGYLEEYQHLENEYVKYTNTDAEGDVQDYLIYGKSYKKEKPTHTFNQLTHLAGMGGEQLLELAGMGEPKIKWFDPFNIGDTAYRAEKKLLVVGFHTADATIVCFDAETNQYIAVDPEALTPGSEVIRQELVKSWIPSTNAVKP